MLNVAESGTILTSPVGTYTTSDVLSIEKVGSNIVYKKNGTVFYTSAKTVSADLLVDAAIYMQGAVIRNAKLAVYQVAP